MHYKVINNIDKGCVKYIENIIIVTNNNKIKTTKNTIDDLTLEDAIERGLKEDAKDLTLKSLKKI